jgi:hypothetical protein
VLFPVRNQLHQAVVVPLFSVVPMCVLLRLRADASNAVLVHVTIGGGLAIAAVLLITFFVSEKWIQPVIRHLLDRGLPVEFDAMPPGRLNTRMTVCFSMILVVTALMIGTLASLAARRPRMPALELWVCTMAGRHRRSKRVKRRNAREAREEVTHQHGLESLDIRAGEI